MSKTFTYKRYDFITGTETEIKRDLIVPQSTPLIEMMKKKIISENAKKTRLCIA